MALKLFSIILVELPNGRGKMMTSEKAMTLRLLKEGIGNPVTLLESTGDEADHHVRAQLAGVAESNRIPILFLLSSLAFLEAKPIQSNNAGLSENDENEGENSYAEVDGWTPADFLSHLRYDGGGGLRIEMSEIRGRDVATEIALQSDGELKLVTKNRGMSARRWLHFVRGRSHLSSV